MAPGPSSLHSNVEPDSVELNWNVALALVVVPDGPAVTDVSGAAVSTRTVRALELPDELPDGVDARATYTWSPLATPESWRSRPRSRTRCAVARDTVPSSTVTVAPGSAAPASVKLALRLQPSAAGVVIVGAPGAVVSTENELVASPVLPAASVAVTVNV